MDQPDTPDPYLPAPGVAQAQRNTALDYALQLHRTNSTRTTTAQAVVTSASTFLGFLRGSDR